MRGGSWVKPAPSVSQTVKCDKTMFDEFFSLESTSPNLSLYNLYQVFIATKQAKAKFPIVTFLKTPDSFL